MVQYSEKLINNTVNKASGLAAGVVCFAGDSVGNFFGLFNKNTISKIKSGLMAVDYAMAIKSVKRIEKVNSKLWITVLALERLKYIVDNYRQSADKNKNKTFKAQMIDFVKSVDLLLVVALLEPFAYAIPYGKPIMLGLKACSLLLPAKSRNNDNQPPHNGLMGKELPA